MHQRFRFFTKSMNISNSKRRFLLTLLLFMFLFVLFKVWKENIFWGSKEEFYQLWRSFVCMGKESWWMKENLVRKYSISIMTYCYHLDGAKYWKWTVTDKIFSKLTAQKNSLALLTFSSSSQSRPDQEDRKFSHELWDKSITITMVNFQFFQVIKITMRKRAYNL